MKYYIVDNSGTVYGDYDSYDYALIQLEYLLDSVFDFEMGLEIIEGI